MFFYPKENHLFSLRQREFNVTNNLINKNHLSIFICRERILLRNKFERIHLLDKEQQTIHRAGFIAKNRKRTRLKLYVVILNVKPTVL